MMDNPSILPFFALLLLSLGCSEKTEMTYRIKVGNPLGMDRSFETVEIDLKSHARRADAKVNTFRAYSVIDSETGKELVSQTVDNDGDGTSDQLLFQPDIKALSERTFELIPTNDHMAMSDSLPACYSRFVPERIDDYAWENNRVAFRTYGPTAQKMVEEDIKGGTLSSGIDAWLKRVSYPIINKWYEKDISGTGSYHKDTGEGLDNFHVGASRGVGGTAIKVDTTYYMSKNFVSYRTICNGPIRTSFILNYADWDASGKTIAEEKHISLDYGSNLARFEIKFQGADTLSVGLTLHENKGVAMAEPKEGWASYWEPHEDSELGIGIVSPKGFMTSFDKYLTHKTDESNLYSFLIPRAGEVIYYAGFGWKKSGRFETAKEWQDYLATFAQKINYPLIVTIN